MKKIIYLVFSIIGLLITNTENASAQIRYGVKGGIDVISHKIDTDILRVSNRLGYQAGFTMEAMIPSMAFGAEISVLYGKKEYELSATDVDATISDYSYISIPLSLKKRFDLSSMLGIFISAGAFANVKIEGGNLSLNKIDDAIEDYKSKNFEAGFTAGAGLRLLDHFDLGLYFRNILTDKYSADNPDISKLNDKQFRSWTVGLTYYF